MNWLAVLTVLHRSWGQVLLRLPETASSLIHQWVLTGSNIIHTRSSSVHTNWIQNRWLLNAWIDIIVWWINLLKNCCVRIWTFKCLAIFHISSNLRIASLLHLIWSVNLSLLTVYRWGIILETIHTRLLLTIALKLACIHHGVLLSFSKIKFSNFDQQIYNQLITPL